ncbi:4Fe-4S dicluster domain-containing protein [Brevibacillus ginsengisoli]|uniref:4Fe-4S dicluster domain-containing protein n=1 Tax=Brevibacillus ginsengisoli TaxID=363854 RepID=UPI003CE8BEC7
MFRRAGFLFNADYCIGCKSCEIACKNENQTAPNVQWRRVKRVTSEVILSISCNHCDNPECFRVCPERAFSKRHDGIVEIHSDLCTGCQLCLSACPYHAPQFDPVTSKVSKCQMCYPRQDLGLPPACVEACTTEALKIIDLNSFENPETALTVPGFPDTQTTRPSILFFPIKPKKRYFLNQ